MREFREIRARLSGDTEVAQTYAGQARVFLGVMKSAMQVNGLAQLSRHYTLPDGSTISVRSAFGQDEIDIFAAPRVPAAAPQVEAPSEETPAPRPVHTESEAKSEHHNAPAEHHDAPAEHHSSETVPAEDAEGLFDRSDYRAEPPPPPSLEEPKEPPIVASYRPYVWIGARITNGPRYEDGTLKNKLHVCVWEDHTGEDPTILSNRNDFVGDTDRGTYPLGAWDTFYPVNDPMGVAYTDDGLCMYQKDNTPQLPMHAPDDEQTEWDIIFVSDPDNELGIQTAAGPVKSVGTGDYMLKFMVVGADCHADRFGVVEVELRVITGKDDGRLSRTHTTSVEHFTSYLMGILPKGWFPPQPEPDPEATVCDTAETPVPDYGANRHGPHWWQGMATAHVPARQVDVAPETINFGGISFSADGETELPDTGFAPGDWYSHFDLCPAMTSVTTLYSAMGCIHTETHPGPIYGYEWFSAASGLQAWGYWRDLGFLPEMATMLDIDTGAALLAVGTSSGSPTAYTGLSFDTTHAMAPFRYVQIYDQHGQLSSRYAEVISIAEWNAAGYYDKFGTFRRGGGTCTKVEQDD